MRLFVNCFNALLLAFFILIPLSCGSSGGSSANDPQNGSIENQVELPPPVLITEYNAEEIARDVFSGGDLGSDLPSFLSKGDVNKELDDVLIGFMANTINRYPAPSSKSTMSDTLYDSCGGYCYVNAYDNESSSVSLTMQMMNYHSGYDCSEPSMTGLLTARADYRTTAYDEIEITNMAMTFHSTQMSVSGLTIIMNGTLTMKTTDQGDSLEMDLTMSIASLDLYYAFSDYTIDSSSSGLNQTLNGGYGNSDYGSVSISTEENMLFGYYDEYPYQGELLLTGAQGENGYSHARVIFDLNEVFIVECDSDGDGIFEWNSGELYW